MAVLTTGQALVRFLENQYVVRDGERRKFVHGVFTVFGHGNVLGLGEALVETDHRLTVYQAHNEQGMAHAATAFAKQKNRLEICAVTSSIGPGAMNMVTAAATATVNRIPLLLLPGDSFACRQPDPVLQQIEHARDPGITANDAFRAVSVYWDRVSRPDQLMVAALGAMRALTDPAATGAVTICLPQDVQAEAYDYPAEFLAERTWTVDRPAASDEVVAACAAMVRASQRPLLIVGGGLRYSDAGQIVTEFCEEFGVPFAETQAGKGTIAWDHPWNLGGIGVTGGRAANRVAADADLVIALGTRLSDFTTASKWAFRRDGVRFMAINVNAMDAHKLGATPMVCDARTGLAALAGRLRAAGYRAAYGDEIGRVTANWHGEVDRLYDDASVSEGLMSQTRVLGLLNEKLLPPEAIVVGASGSLPGDMQRLWRTREPGSYHMEYGFSCMGYEISGALGAAIAEPERPVVAMTGDGSYLMLHSEIVTAVREGIRLIVIVFDNSGYQCIDNLQTSKGITSCATWFRTRTPDGRLAGAPPAIDFAANARSYGALGFNVSNEEELARAVESALAFGGPSVIDVKVSAKSMTGDYESWWRVGVPEVSAKGEVRRALDDQRDHLTHARPF